MSITLIQDDMFTPDVIADPYSYYGQIRDEDPSRRIGGGQ